MMKERSKVLAKSDSRLVIPAFAGMTSKDKSNTREIMVLRHGAGIKKQDQVGGGLHA
jgi:hypothetical protein